VLFSEENSVKTTTNIKKDNIDFYNIIQNKVFVKPIGIYFWTTYLEIQDFQK
jgi:hypothetical protein